MKIRAYVLIKIEPSSSMKIIRSLRKLKAIILADLVSGPYDTIVVIEAADMNDVAEFVINEVSSIPGVASTITCLALEVSN